MITGVTTPGSLDWFVITTDDRSIHLAVSAPGQEAWQDSIRWDTVIRVCLEAEPGISDCLYVFTSLRPESWVIPMEAAGGPQLLDELVRRSLFHSELAAEAAKTVTGLFCWPPAQP